MGLSSTETQDRENSEQLCRASCISSSSSNPNRPTSPSKLSLVPTLNSFQEEKRQLLALEFPAMLYTDFSHLFGLNSSLKGRKPFLNQPCTYCYCQDQWSSAKTSQEGEQAAGLELRTVSPTRKSPETDKTNLRRGSRLLPWLQL